MKKKDNLEVSMPKDFDGEIEVTGFKTTRSSIETLDQEFGNGDMNILRAKINEIIAKG